MDTSGGCHQGVEGGLQGLTGSEVDKARLKIAGVLTSAKPPPSNLPWSLDKCVYLRC